MSRGKEAARLDVASGRPQPDRKERGRSSRLVRENPRKQKKILWENRRTSQEKVSFVLFCFSFFALVESTPFHLQRDSVERAECSTNRRCIVFSCPHTPRVQQYRELLVGVDFPLFNQVMFSVLPSSLLSTYFPHPFVERFFVLFFLCCSCRFPISTLAGSTRAAVVDVLPATFPSAFSRASYQAPRATAYTTTSVL